MLLRPKNKSYTASIGIITPNPVTGIMVEINS